MFQDPLQRAAAAAWFEEARGLPVGEPVRVEQVEIAGRLARVVVEGAVPGWGPRQGCEPADGEDPARGLVCPEGEWWDWMQARRVGRMGD